MDSSVIERKQLTGALVGRTLLFACLASISIQLLVTTHLYAVVSILVGLGALVLRDMTQVIARADRSMARVIDELSAHGCHLGGDRKRVAIKDQLTKVTDQLQSARLANHGELQFMEALLDTVTAALLVVRENGTVVLVNRSARRLAAQSVSTLHQIAALGCATADRISAMQPGTRQVVYLADGQPVYVSASEFRGIGSTNQRLISLQRIAGELDAVEVKAWQDVASVLAHEMMNSLTPIASLSEGLDHLLRDARMGIIDLTSSEISGALEAIKRRSHGLMNFVERYRSIAQVPDARPQHIDLQQFFSTIDRLMNVTLREAGIAYHRQPITAELSIIADPELLEQAVINLVRNAGDAAAQATAPSVNVTCELRNTDLVIAVADNGPGLNEEQRDRIFVPFYSTKPNGSGIGLSLARQVALAHGGRIDVESNDPAGSVFCIVLPYNKSLAI